MKAFTIHEAPEPPHERGDRADALMFVQEGFSWSAFLLAPLWFLLNGLWIALAGYVAFCAAIIAPVLLLDLDHNIIAIGLSALHLIIGFESDNLLRWTLAQNGWQELGAVTGRNQDECERNFFDAWLPSQPFIATSGTGTSTLGQKVNEL